jgi:hypothetical protein
MTRDQFIIIYERFESEYSNALKKADLEYQEVIASVNSYQKIVNPVGKEVGKAISPDVEFVLKDKILPNGNTQKSEIYFFKEDPLTLTIPSGIEGYPDFGPFDIDPVDHPSDKGLSSEKLSVIYGKIVSGYTSPILFKYLEVNFLLDEVSFLRKEIVTLQTEVKDLRRDVRLLQIQLGILTGGATTLPDIIKYLKDKLI